MSEKAPIKLSIDYKGQACPWPYPFNFTVRYVRADIVDELVEALKGLQVWTSLAIHNEYVKPMIEDALAKLEESHD